MKTGNLALIRKLMGPIDLQKTSLSVTIKTVDTKKHIVTGEVYPPYVLDTHGELMEPEDVEYMAHAFINEGRTASFDVMHNNRLIKAQAVESWIARGHPDYNEGAWVLSTKIYDKVVWKKIEKGELGGYSIEALVRKVPAIAEYEVEPNVVGFTEKHGDHEHAYFLFVNGDGVVTGGFTSVVNNHRHLIRNGTRTEVSQKHAHRLFI